MDPSVKQFLAEVAPDLSLSLNILSLTSSAIVLITAAALRICKPSLMNRVTLRLQIGISVFDMFTHFFALFHQTKGLSEGFCSWIGFYRSFGNMVYCFLNIMIALNLQLVFLHSMQPKVSWEVFYWVVTLGLSLLANIPPYALDFFGKNRDGLCFFNVQKPLSDLVMLINTNGMMIFTCVYCFLVSTCVAIKLFRDVSVLKQMKTNTTLDSSNFRPKLINHLKKLIFRISLYPIVCFLSLSGFITRYLVGVSGGNVMTVGFITWSLFGLTTSGFFNMLAFFLDPTLHNAIGDLYQDLKHRYAVFKYRKNNPSSNIHTISASVPESEIELNKAYTEYDQDKTEVTITTNSIYEGMSSNDAKALNGFTKFL